MIVGGLVAYNDGSVINCFWDTETSEKPYSDGGTGKTTVEMQTLLTFTDAGWDFIDEDINGNNNFWRMCVIGVDYPRLSWEYAQNGDFACSDGIDTVDLQTLVSHWLMTITSHPTTFSYACDANSDGQINFEDYAILSKHWFE